MILDREAVPLYTAMREYVEGPNVLLMGYSSRVEAETTNI